VTAAIALAGWLLALLAGWRVLALGRRLELVACAEHELRGPLAALTLAVGRSRPLEPGVVDGQLDRARIALADLTNARRGRRASAIVRRHDMGRLAARAAAGWSAAGGEVRVDWRAGDAAVDADAGRIAQALGNLLSNALEHGGGRAFLRGRRYRGGVRIEIASRGGVSAPGRRSRRRDRGRGLAIATRAIEDAGGHLRLVSGPDGTTAAVDLPLADV
jgi:signal transduction histidine kinase